MHKAWRDVQGKHARSMWRRGAKASARVAAGGGALAAVRTGVRWGAGAALAALVMISGVGAARGQATGSVPGTVKAAPVLHIVNARILTMSGDGLGEIERGRLVVRGGKVAAVGPVESTAAPTEADAVTIDAAGKWVMPGIICTHSHIGGIGGADSSAPMQPDVRIYDSINTRDSGFRRAVAGGLTTLNIMPGSGHLMSGQTVYVKLRGRVGEAGDPAAGPGAVGRAGGAGAGAGGGASSGGAAGADGSRAQRAAVRIEDLFYLDADGRPMGGLKMANGTNMLGSPPFPGTRGKSAALVRDLFVKAQEYQAKLDRATTRNADGTVTIDPEKAPARDLGNEVLLEALAGKRIVHHHTHRVDDIMTVLRIAEEFKLRVVLHHVSEAWKSPEEIAKARAGWGAVDAGGKGLGDPRVKGAPCSVILVDSPGGKLEARNLSYETGGILERAGVLVAFHTDDWITDSRLFLRMAALGVRGGMSRPGALRALTIHGAMMLDLSDRIGSLEVGKDGDVVILSGDPLSVYTKVEKTFVEGRLVFDRGDARDLLYANGGMGAGHDQSPYLCCAGGSIFSFGGQQWSQGGAGHENAAEGQAAK